MAGRGRVIEDSPAKRSQGTEDNPSKRKPINRSEDENFCPDLVVPPNCECILILPLDGLQRMSTFEITDINGIAVLRVTPQPAMQGRSFWQATVNSAVGELLAQCCEAVPGAASMPGGEFYLSRSGGQLFAKLNHIQAQDRYLLTYVNSSAILHFWGDFDGGVVNVTDTSDLLFATTETGSADFNQSGSFCKLRVAPGADVGLALCGLLCVGQHKRNQRKLSAMDSPPAI
jgi:hypothetical protein